MNKIKKGILLTLGIGALVVSLSACGGPKEYVTGTVIEEGGTLPGLIKNPERFFSNETVKIGELTYVIKFETDQGTYVASVKENIPIDGRYEPLEALEFAVEEGTKIEVEKWALDLYGRFGGDKVGYLFTDEIKVLE